jgi:hypothetical protein
VFCELREQSVQQWQNEWEISSKGAKTRSFFPKIEDSLILRLNATPTFTAIVTGHGNIKSYLYKYKITDNPMCPCNDRYSNSGPHPIGMHTPRAGKG